MVASWEAKSEEGAMWKWKNGISFGESAHAPSYWSIASRLTENRLRAMRAWNRVTRADVTQFLFENTLERLYTLADRARYRRDYDENHIRVLIGVIEGIEPTGCASFDVVYEALGFEPPESVGQVDRSLLLNTTYPQFPGRRRKNKKNRPSQ